MSKNGKNEDMKSNVATMILDSDLEGTEQDEFGVTYSKDGKNLLKAKLSSDLQEYHIKEGTKVICDYAFAWCVSVRRITMPRSVVYIGKGAFAYCESIRDIIIPDSTNFIGEKAFEGCKSLESIVIPESVAYIGDSVFYGCRLMKSIKISNSQTVFGGFMVEMFNSLKHVYIPRNTRRKFEKLLPDLKSILIDTDD